MSALTLSYARSTLNVQCTVFCCALWMFNCTFAEAQPLQYKRYIQIGRKTFVWKLAIVRSRSVHLYLPDLRMSEIFESFQPSLLLLNFYFFVCLFVMSVHIHVCIAYRCTLCGSQNAFVCNENAKCECKRAWNSRWMSFSSVVNFLWICL